MTEKTLPISETFDSMQGEGLWGGTRFFFIRLAGCTVGKPFARELPLRLGTLEKDDDRKQFEAKIPTHKIVPSSDEVGELLPIYQEKCTLYDGREFACDTDYRVKERLSAAQLLGSFPTGILHVCFTGGEPLMHDLSQVARMIKHWYDNKVMVHIETSGSILLENAFKEVDTSKFWVTVSPKFGVLPEMINRANEIKLLVDDDFELAKLPREVLSHPLVWISPINFEHTLNKHNFTKCVELQQLFPHWRIATQLHKVFGVR